MHRVHSVFAHVKADAGTALDRRHNARRLPVLALRDRPAMPRRLIIQEPGLPSVLAKGMRSVALHSQRLCHLVPEGRVLDLAEELVDLIRAHLRGLDLLLQRILLVCHDLVLDRIPLQVGLQLSKQLPLDLLVLSIVLELDQFDS